MKSFFSTLFIVLFIISGLNATCWDSFQTSMQGAWYDLALGVQDCNSRYQPQSPGLHKCWGERSAQFQQDVVIIADTYGSCIDAEK